MPAIKGPGPPNSSVAEILEVERRWVPAHCELELNSLGQILDDRYAQLRPEGQLIGKQDLLTSYSPGKR